MSGFFELVNKRESCRNYSGEPIERELIEKCIEAARLSPSACNSQPWTFVMADGEIAREVAKCTQKSVFNKFTDNCPAFIVICENEATLSSKLTGIVAKQHFAQMDIGLTTAHICYQATDSGLSTCILGIFDEDRLKEILAIPKNKKIRLVLAIGYAADGDLRTKKRKEFSDVARWAD